MKIPVSAHSNWTLEAYRVKCDYVYARLISRPYCVKPYVLHYMEEHVLCTHGCIIKAINIAVIKFISASKDILRSRCLHERV